MNTVLLLGTGQVGKSVLERLLLEKNINRIIVHNLKKEESEFTISKYKDIRKDIEYINSYGDVFKKNKLKNITIDDFTLEQKKEYISFLYSEINEELINQTVIFNLIKKWKPKYIIDCMNSSTTLGEKFTTEYYLNYKNINDKYLQILIDNFIPKIRLFILGLSEAIRNFNVEKYIKVSTTGLGGMGIMMPYTHGDTPKYNLSNALIGKISASGVMHQLLWTLYHTYPSKISLIIPGTFVGYDSIKNERVENNRGFIKKCNSSFKRILKEGEKIKLLSNIGEYEYLNMPVVRAGENHVYSKDELNLLTELGQMEAITKDEVANYVMAEIKGGKVKNVLAIMDCSMLEPTYAGREMINNLNSIFNEKYKFNKNGIATGNLGPKISKELYELFIIFSIFNSVNEFIEEFKIENWSYQVNNFMDKNNELAIEIISLGMIIVYDFNYYQSGEYLSCEENMHIDDMIKICGVDLRKENIKEWQKTFIEFKEYTNNCKDSFRVKYIEYDYNKQVNCIGELLAKIYNYKNKGRIS